MLITDLKPTKNQKRINLFLDHQFAFSLEPELVVKHQLKTNQAISLKKLELLIFEALFAKLYQKALNFISYRPRSQKELKLNLTKHLKKLVKNQNINPQNLIQKVIQKLKSQNLIDDHQFASWWVKQRSTHRPKGNLALKSELIQKGLDSKIIQKHLPDFDQQLQNGLQAFQKKFKKLTPPLTFKQKNKIYTYLNSRGFSSQIIKSIIDQHL